MIKMKNKIIKYSKVMAVLFLFLFGFGFVANAAWTNPSAAPTGGNTPTPINVGSTYQTKAGDLSIGSKIRLYSNNGNVTAKAFLYSSDRRLKENIEIISGNKLEDLLKLQGVLYTWKTDGQQDVGLIAQEVEEFYPELVVTDEDGYKAVEYAGLIAPLIEITKQQQKRIDSLEKRIEILEKNL